MAHDHAHGGHSAAQKHSGRLLIVLAMTAAFTVVEIVAGLLTNSLVLLADAGHMLTDVVGLTLALVATWFARRPATPAKTYGYYRLEILAAAMNALLLLVIADGMGGHMKGELAAEIAVTEITRHFQQEARSRLRKPVDFLVSAINAAHRAIVAQAVEENLLESPRTTCVACMSRATAPTGRTPAIRA